MTDEINWIYWVILSGIEGKLEEKPVELMVAPGGRQQPLEHVRMLAAPGRVGEHTATPTALFKPRGEDDRFARWYPLLGDTVNNNHIEHLEPVDYQPLSHCASLLPFTFNICHGGRYFAVTSHCKYGPGEEYQHSKYFKSLSTATMDSRNAGRVGWHLFSHCKCFHILILLLSIVTC